MAGVLKDSFGLAQGDGSRKSYTENTGTMKVVSTNGASIIASVPTVWGVGYDELMCYPEDQLTNEYLFPWYNNKAMRSQLRIGNTGGVAADVDVYIGGVKQNDTPYNIPVGESVRLEYAGVNDGPVQVVTNTSGASILATMRVIWVIGYVGLRACSTHHP